MPSQHSCMKVRLIINPISGTRNKAGLDRLVAESLSPLGWEVETVYTKGHGDATRLALSAVEKGCGIVLAAGGAAPDESSAEMTTSAMTMS